MQITDFKSITAGVPYFDVEEEYWFMVDEDEADRDFRPMGSFTTLAEAVNCAAKSDVTGRIYIDVMTRNENGAAGGQPVFAGYKSGLYIATDWRLENMDAAVFQAFSDLIQEPEPDFSAYTVKPGC